MISSWLEQLPFNPQPDEFEGFHLVEKSLPTSTIKEYVANLLLEEHAAKDFIDDLISDLGWEKVRETFLERYRLGYLTGKRGDFGEILSIEIMRSFLHFLVPISKFRYKLIPGQSLPSTDALGIKLNEKKEISEVCYLESKLRTKKYRMAAVEGHNQLVLDYKKRVPDILFFIYQRLRETKHELFGPFRRYLISRSNTAENDRFHLSLCWEHNEWDNAPLVALLDNGINLPNLMVSVTRISNLAPLVDEIYTMLGLTGPFEDE